MSYREENGQVVLTMSREDFKELDSCEKLVQIFEERIGFPPIQRKAVHLRFRLNDGNPNFTHYKTP